MEVHPNHPLIDGFSIINNILYFWVPAIQETAIQRYHSPTLSNIPSWFSEKGIMKIVAQSSHRWKRKNCHVTAPCHSLWEIQMELLHGIDMEICHRSLGIGHLKLSATKLASMQCSGGGTAQVAAILISMPAISTRVNMNEERNSKDSNLRFFSWISLFLPAITASF